MLNRCAHFAMLLLLPSLLWGQTQQAVNTDNLYHWAYGTAFGTGAYRVGSDRVLVVRVSPGFELKNWEDQRLALNLILPVTIGFQDTDLGGIGSVDLDTFLQTISFVPGLDLVWYPYEQWRLKPFGHYGGGVQLEGSESAQIYYGGINSRYAFDLGGFDMDLLNAVHWLGYFPNQGDTDRLSRLITGLEWEIPLGSVTLARQQALLRPHIAHFWYFNELGFKQLQSPPVELKQEFEIGLALGTPDKMSLGFFKFDRIGLAYRTSENIEGIRLYFGSIMN
jgi:hypothetical protein